MKGGGLRALGEVFNNMSLDIHRKTEAMTEALVSRTTRALPAQNVRGSSINVNAIANG